MIPLAFIEIVTLIWSLACLALILRGVANGKPMREAILWTILVVVMSMTILYCCYR